MKVISIRQPWAYAILHLGKDIENRDRKTFFRGRFLIHAGKTFDQIGYEWLCTEGTRSRLAVIPPPQYYELGGIVGSAVLRDVVRASQSPWFFGPYGYVLQGAKSCAFIPCRGQVTVPFDIADDLVREAVAA